MIAPREKTADVGSPRLIGNIITLAMAATTLSINAPVRAAESEVAAADSEMEEIVVVGQGIGSLRLSAGNGAGGRLGLSAFQTPASVDLITKEELAAKGDYEVLQAITRSNGISSTASPGNGGTAVSSRGFNGHNTTLVTYDGTRLYITAGTVTFPADTWTLDRVEVLRGAGSVINGVGALGTTINYIPKAPQFGSGGFDAQLGAGSFGMRRVALGGGTKLSERWAYRLDAAHHEADGYADRADERRDVMAGSLLFQPSKNLRVKFSVDRADIEDAPYWGTPLINGKASDSHRRNNYNFADGFVEYEDLWVRTKTEWQLSPRVTLRNEIYHLDVRREWQNLEEYAYNETTDQIDRAFYLGIVHDQQQVGTRSDLHLESAWGDPRNQLTLGAEINSIDLRYSDNFSTGGFGVADSVPLNRFDPNSLPSSIATIPDYTTDTRQYAFFFDDVLRLTAEMSLVVGGRYDNIEFDRFDYAIGSSAAAEFDSDFSEFTWRAGFVYQPSDSLSIYLQVSRAADPVTSPITISASNQDFDLSRGRQYEIGMKQQILNGHGEYTVAYFDIEKRDIPSRRPASGITEQIGQQSSDGFEFTLRFNPTDRLSLDMNAAWVDAEFDRFFSGVVSLSGNTPRNIPDKTANLWLTWYPMDRLHIGGGVRYVSGRYGDHDNTLQLPSYTVFDASFGWEVSSQAMLLLRARNLTDEDDYVLSQYTPNQWIFGDRRSFELTFRFPL